MRVIGIDPGTQRMGVGVVESRGDEMDFIYSGVIVTQRRDPISDRLHDLYIQLLHCVASHHPTVMAIESPFASVNIKAAMAIGQAHAVAMLVAAHYGLDVSNYAPRQVKQAVADHGGSSKEQVQGMVRILLGLDDAPLDLDASDALAVAICHINASQIVQLSSID